MPVLVMQVGVVGVTMDYRVVGMPMRVGLACRIAGTVVVLMVLVVRMPMLVVLELMVMMVLVMLGHMQPETETHKKSCHD